MIRRTFLAVLILLAAGLAGGDAYARYWAEGQLQQRIAAAVPEAQNVSASIDSFPFVGRLAVAGEVQGVSAHAGPVTEGRITFDHIDVSLRGVKLDRTVLLRDRLVRLLGIHSGLVSAVMTDQELSQALGGVPLTMTPGRLEATLNGVRVTAVVSLINNELRLAAPGLTVISLRIPTNAILPCSASAQVLTGRLVLACVLTAVPAGLIEAALRASA